MKYGDIVKRNGQLGKIVTDDKGNFLFHPAGFGRYYYSDLEIVTEEDVEQTNHDEKVDYLIKEFCWGHVGAVHAIGDIIVFEYSAKKGETGFHTYINYEDTNHTYDTLDQALVGTIDIKYNGPNSQAAGFFYKMVGM